MSYKSNQSLIVLTTTAIPYVYYVPKMLSTPSGIPDLFRYQNKWLDESADKKNNCFRQHSGILYLRDNESCTSLCFPLRRFTILWSENNNLFSFFYLKMGPLVSYDLVAYSSNEGWPRVINERTSKESYDNLRQELAERRAAGKLSYKIEAVAVPAANEPPILTDRQLHGITDFPPPGYDPIDRTTQIPFDKFVWVDARTMFRLNSSIFVDEVRDNENWTNQISVFSLVEKLRDTCFWRVMSLQALHKHSKRYSPQKIRKDDKSGFYTHGYRLRAHKYYAIELTQTIPRVLAQESFHGPQFELTIGDSDPGVSPFNKTEIVDSLYDRFELSFQAVPDFSADVTLLRVACTQKVRVESRGNQSDLSNQLRHTVIPMRIYLRSEWPGKILFFLLTLLSVSVFLFHKEIYNWFVGAPIADLSSNVIRIIFLMCALYFSKKSGTTDTLKHLTQKVG